jgi:hypothetical protein
MTNATFPFLSGNNILVYEVNITDETGIDVPQNVDLDVYPNPTTGELGGLI